MIVTIAHPHEIWPPLADEAELLALIDQRKKDISIKGRTGIIKELEDAFLDYLDHKMKYCISFNSGTSALLAAYFALGIEEGDEVIVPALTFHAAISPLFILRANPILIDVDRHTRCIDPRKIEQAITPKTKAITVVHQWGHPGDILAILKVAKKHNLKVIEDCSHAHGSTYKGKKVGTFGDVAVFSLQAAKMLYAGEGGLLVTSNTEYHDRATLLGHYRDRSLEEIKDPFYQSFWVTGYGLKLRMSPYNAVTALHALKKLDYRIEQRRKCLYYFMSFLKELPEIEVPFIADWAGMGGWYGFKPLYIQAKNNDIDRGAYIALLVAEGVEIAVPSAPVLADLPLYNLKKDKMFLKRSDKKTHKSKSFPVAQFFANNSLSLPTFSDWERDKPVIDQYVKAFQKISKLVNKRGI